MFVKVENIAKLVTEKQITDIFECCGEILELRFDVRNPAATQTCYIKFANPSDCETALVLSGVELGDTKLSVTPASEQEAQVGNLEKNSTPGDEYAKALSLVQNMMQGPGGTTGPVDDPAKRTIYVGNLSQACTPQHLIKEFGVFGEVAYIKFSQGKKEFRYAFIEFGTEESATKAFSLHGKTIAGSTIKVGKAHNPIFKDSMSHQENPLFLARKHAERVKERLDDKTSPPLDDKENTKNRRRRGSHKTSNRDRDRDRNRSRRKHNGRRRRRSPSHSNEAERGENNSVLRGSSRRGRSRSYEKSINKNDDHSISNNNSEKKEEEGSGENKRMFFDGFQWHWGNDEKGTMVDVQEQVTSVIRSDVDVRREPVDLEKQMQNAAAEALKKLQQKKQFLHH